MARDLNLAYQWAIEKCKQANVGYSQDYRNEMTVDGLTYYDCSSFIWYALMYAGFDVVSANGGSTWPFTTWTMDAALTLLGFTTMSTYIDWQAGDILLREGHCEFVYEGRKTMGAHSSTYDFPDQVSINTFDSSPDKWETLYRYVDGIAPKRKKMPLWMMCRFY